MPNHFDDLKPNSGEKRSSPMRGAVPSSEEEVANAPRYEPDQDEIREEGDEPADEEGDRTK